MIHDSGSILANKYKGAPKSCRKAKAFIKAEKERDKDVFYQKAQKVDCFRFRSLSYSG